MGTITVRYCSDVMSDRLFLLIVESYCSFVFFWLFNPILGGSPKPPSWGGGQICPTLISSEEKVQFPPFLAKMFILMSLVKKNQKKSKKVMTSAIFEPKSAKIR